MIEKILGRMGVEVSWYLTTIEIAKERWREEALGYAITLKRGRRSQAFKYRALSEPVKVPTLEETMALVLVDERSTRILSSDEINELLLIVGESK
jgi:hypothetical protein